ncbi:MAG TPA: valine--pyruvate transaminase [Gammaproteobacteria bacterium]|jgi:valine--pyruvate aminotransferase
MKLSEFGRRFSGPSGINQLMEDLGEALAGSREMFMLGGGNPAHIPEVQAFFQDRLQRLAQNPGEFARVIGDYDAPRGEPKFLKALADLLNREYDWKLTPDHLCLTTGSQSSFFMLFNMLAGDMGGGRRSHVLLPMTPEYIGYADVGVSDGLFRANRPAIEELDDRQFKYHVDFDRLIVTGDTAAICVSRPTNPTGNVLTDGEMEKLHALARGHDIPLIVDNAYGLPFPSIVFGEASMPFSDHVILCMSLSKLGLPGVRTGIVIARPEIAGALARMNAIFSLAMGSVGPALAYDLVTSGEILNLSRNVIRPYYERRARHVIDLFRKALDGIDYHIHRAEGAIFLWLWFPGMPITSEELYRRLKDRGTIVVSGHYFFPGLAEDWPHRHECIRVSYTMRDDVVRRGVDAIAEEVKRAFAA